MLIPPYPILVVSYDENSRTSLAASLTSAGAVAAVCATFCDAEKLAHCGLYSGLLVDLVSVVRAKGEEKIVAYTLANYFPTLRVRTLGAKLEPATTPGGAAQDRNLEEFLQNSCVEHSPRKLREFRRHFGCLSTVVSYMGHDYRGFTLDLSYGGAFIADIDAGKYSVGDSLTVLFTEFDHKLSAEVRMIKLWGVQRHAPGIGVRFLSIEEPLESDIASVIRTRKELDRDRLTA